MFVPATDDAMPCSSIAPRVPGVLSVGTFAAVELPEPVLPLTAGVVACAPGMANICMRDVPELVTLGADSEPPATL
jgi:hypothetical protein